METKKLNTKKQSGITLVALVVTIIILIILATISIRMVIGEGGIIWQANQAKVEHRAATVDEEVLSWKAEKQMAKYADDINPMERDDLIDDQLKRGLLTEEEAETAKRDGQVKIGSRTINYGEDTLTNPPSTEKDERPLVNDLTDLQPKTVEARDRNGNSVTMPGKFKFAGEKTDTVEQGIVIEDSDGNQFVWIPVSNIDGDNNKDTMENQKEEDLIILDHGEKVEITLGRYDFSKSSPGTATIKQKGSEYANETAFIPSGKPYDLKELKTARESTGDGSSLTDVNATAKNLQAFVESVKENHGYYIGRYEASYGSGSAFGVGNDESYYKPLVQKSTKNTGTSTESSAWRAEKGFLWNFITQGDASKVCRNMYNENDDESQYVESDLVNSYMWDTAIVYIQAMGNSNYANKKGTEINTSLVNTGENDDHPCKIYDMAGNLLEWTTEYSTSTDSSSADPCVYRGGHYAYSSGITAGRYNDYVTNSNVDVGFRPGLYVK